MMRVLYLLVGFLVGILPAFFSSSISAEEAEPEWIPSEMEMMVEYTVTFGVLNIPAIVRYENKPVDEACGVLQAYIDSIMVYTITNQSGCSITSSGSSWESYIMQTDYEIPNAGTGSRGDPMSISWQNVLQGVCNDPAYQIPVDSTGTGTIDQCHKSNCPESEFFWSNGNGVATPSGKICIQYPPPADGSRPQGKSCQYEAIENSDGSKSSYTFQPTGDGCSCGSESVPCQNASDGEVTNYPQGQNGCVQIADAIMCDADPEEHCKNGVCDSGCGYIGDRFTCIETNVTDEEARACAVNDTRFSCNGLNEGECPTGVINCLPLEQEEPPPAPCVENDTRPECEGVPVGESPPTTGEGTTGEAATSEDMEKLGGKLDLVNTNLRDIKSDTKKLVDHLGEKIDPPEIDPDDSTDWSNTKALVDQYTSAGDVNADQVNFETNMAGQEGFFNNQIIGVVPALGGCGSLSITFPYATGQVIECEHLAATRFVIEWALVLGFIFYVYSAIGRLKPNGA